MTTQINPTTGLRVDLFGPTVEFLTSPQEASIDFCVLRGVIPPSISVPLHSHSDTEDFFVISGEVRALQGTPGYAWIWAKAGGLPPHAQWHTARLAQSFQPASGRIHHHDHKTWPILSGGGKTSGGHTSTSDGRGSCALPCALRDRIP